MQFRDAQYSLSRHTVRRTNGKQTRRKLFNKLNSYFAPILFEKFPWNFFVMSFALNFKVDSEGSMISEL
jgi:hypothetical protein